MKEYFVKHHKEPCVAMQILIPCSVRIVTYSPCLEMQGIVLLGCRKTESLGLDVIIEDCVCCIGLSMAIQYQQERYSKSLK